MSEKLIARDLSVVIPTLGRDSLRESVRALATGSVLPRQIILVHQGIAGSMDAMLTELDPLGIDIRYVHSTLRGCAAGRNTGIQLVTTRFFATTDDDCNADSKWVEVIVAALEKNPGEIVTGRVLASEPGAPSVVTSEQPRLFTRATLKGDHFTGGNFATALDIYKDVEPFDETELIRFCEDNEWSFRAFAKGYAIRYLPQMIVTHLHWRDDANMAKVYSQYAASQGGWYGRKLRQGDVSFVARLLYEVSRGGKRWFLGSLRNNYLRKVNGRAFVIDLLKGVAAGWNER
jgi:GT2 family glycosyltransferase